MAGKHRKSARRRSTARRRLVPGLTAAAVSATSLTTALTTGATVTVASPAVELTALITPANSTAQIFASSDYYNRDWVDQYGQPQVVPFLLGPQGIVNAIDSSYQKHPTERIAVLASGWGAGQTGTAIGIMQANHDPAINNLDLVVLDNNTNRAGGGFWTTYSIFAPLLLTSGAPTPSNTQAPILDVAYEYNINSDAPTDPLNPFADANSLVAYVYGYGAQATAPVPDDIIDEAENTDPNTATEVVHHHYVLNEDGTIAKDAAGNPMVYDLPEGTTTTYVTFKSDRLPLVRPLLLLPGGEIIADAVEPTLTVLVNAGYKGNEPIPTDPTETRPMEPGSSVTNILASGSLPGAAQQGMQDGVAATKNDLTNPSDLVTGPVDEFKKTAGSLTNSSPVPLASTNSPKPSTSAFDISATDKKSPDAGSTTPSSGGPKGPVRQVIGRINSALSSVANSLTHGGQKNPNNNTSSESSSPSSG